MITVNGADDGALPEMLKLLVQSGLPAMGLAPHMASALVARSADQIVGCAALELYGTAALLRSVAVAEAWRGQGVGHRLVSGALDLARQHDVQHVYLLTETAAPFFQQLGFDPIERAAVLAPVQQSIEFREVCPASAQVLAIELG